MLYTGLRSIKMASLWDLLKKKKRISFQVYFLRQFQFKFVALSISLKHQLYKIKTF